MPRKTSFCNGTLLRSDLRHYWPAGFLYVLVWLVLLPIPLLQTGFDYARSWPDRPELLAAELHNIYYSAMTGSMVLAVLAGIVMPMAVYAYLMAPRAVGLMHALPVKRTTQYFSHFAAGFGLLTGGNVLIFLLSVLAQLPYGGADWAAAGLWLLVTELLELFFLSLGTLCAMANQLLNMPQFRIGAMGLDWLDTAGLDSIRGGYVRDGYTDAEVSLTREQAVELCRLAQQDAAGTDDTDALGALLSGNGGTANTDTDWDMYRYQVVIYGGGEKGQDEAYELTMMSYCTRMRDFITGLDFPQTTVDPEAAPEVTP